MQHKFSFFGLVLLAFCSSFVLSKMPPLGYKPGDTAIDFELKNIDGKKYSLSGVKDAKGYIVVFTCNNCPYAIGYEDRVIGLHQKYAAKGFPVIAINSNDPKVAPNDSYEKMVTRATEKSIPYLYLYDDTQDIAKAYGATRTPHVYLLDKDRKVQYIGAIDDNFENPEDAKEKYVESAIDALLAGKEVAIKESKAIGCTIKWRKDQ